MNFKQNDDKSFSVWFKYEELASVVRCVKLLHQWDVEERERQMSTENSKIVEAETKL